MAREVVNTRYTQKRPDQTNLAAIVIAVAALVIALFAWNNTRSIPQTQTAQPLISQQTQRQAVEDVRSQLEEVNRKLAESGNYEEAGRSVARIRQDFKISFQNAGDKARASWQNVDDELNIIEAQLREKSTDAGSAIERLIENLRNFRFDITVPKAQ